MFVSIDAYTYKLFNVRALDSNVSGTSVKLFEDKSLEDK